MQLARWAMPASGSRRTPKAEKSATIFAIETGGPANKFEKKSSIPPHRGHFAALDAVRGIAAISVILFHLGHWLAVPSLATNSGLAVDLFFCLSGYVLSLAYQERLRGGMSFAKFVQIRLIRLWPLIALGTTLSFTFVIARALIEHDGIQWGVLALAPIMGMASIPFLGAPQYIGGPQIFPLNGPQYTLFLELLVNFAWAACRQLRRLPLIPIVTALALVAILTVGLGGDQDSTFLLGFPRVMASYFLGVMLYLVEGSLPTIVTRKRVFLCCLVVMLGLFYFPAPLPLSASLIWIAVASPILVISGAHMRLSNRWSGAGLFLGRMSYPLYVLHYPLFCWSNGLFQTVFKHQSPLWEIPLCFLTIVGGSYLALIAFDEKVRAVLVRSRGVLKPT
jgi:peptidoglycan/LPS O-acetylase OafA/YrhL